MTKDEALKLARTALGVQLDALLGKAGHLRNDDRRRYAENGITAIKEALAQPEQDWSTLEAMQGSLREHMARIKELESQLAQPEQEPVAWLITDEKINSLQVGSIQRLIDRARHAHMTDIKLRINGQDEWYEADWLKHLTRTTPPQRKPLTDEEIEDIWADCPADWDDKINVLTLARAIEAAHGIKGKV